MQVFKTYDFNSAIHIINVVNLHQAGVINASDRLLPLYVVNQLSGSRGVPGFFVAGIFAASLG